MMAHLLCVQVQGVLQRRDRVGKIVLAEVSIAQVRQGIRIVGVERKRLRVGLHGLIEVAAGHLLLGPAPRAYRTPCC
jgi:hypothetical protein